MRAGRVLRENRPSMKTPKNQSGDRPSRNSPAAQDDKQARRADALRANLKRRKQAHGDQHGAKSDPVRD